MIATLLSGRLTFALGVAIGLAALVALDSERPLLSRAARGGHLLRQPGRRLLPAADRRDPGASSTSVARGAILGIAAALPVALMAVAFPTSGPEPFVLSSLLGTLAVTLFVLFALPREERLLRRGAAVYAVAVLVVYAIPNAMGGNVVRLSNLAAAPVLVLGLAGPRRRLLLALCAVPLLYWQWQGAVRDVSRAITDPAAQRSYLHAADLDPARADRTARPCGSRSRRPRIAGRSITWARSSSSPAAGSASSNPTKASCSAPT